MTKLGNLRGDPERDSSVGRVLIVEDEAIVAEDLRLSMERIGYQVIGVADSGAKAFQVLQKNRPDIILMDVQLKGGSDGVEVGECIKSEYEIPILYISAFSDRELLARIRKIRPCGYISKPIRQKDLKLAIELAIDRENDRDQLDGELATQLLDALHLGVCFFNARQKILFANDDFCQLMETEKSVVDAQTVGTIIRKRLVENFASFLDDIEQVLLDQKERQRCVSIQAKKPNTIQVEYRMVPIVRNKKIAGIALFVTNLQYILNKTRECFTFLVKAGNKDTKPDRFQDYVDAVQSVMGESQPHSLRQFASDFNMNPKYFSRVFKKRLGQTFTQYRLSQKMAIAKELLADKNFKIYQISDRLGYVNPSAFMKMFKRSTGLTPSEYRAKFKDL